MVSRSMHVAAFFALALALTASVASAARPVARWDVIPDQLLDAPFNAGVVAFHTEGVKVEFRVNGSLVHTATHPTLNPRTDVWEYWFTLDPADYPDGPVTVDARAICLNPAPANPDYDLPSLILHANSGGALGSTVVKWADAVNGSDGNTGAEAAPYQTLSKAVQNTPAGGTVYLKAGTYSADAISAGKSRPYWTTVSAAPGLGWDDVELSEGRTSTDKLRLKNLSVFSTDTGSYNPILTGENGSTSIWLDNVKIWNKNGRYAAQTVAFGNKYVSYVTGGLSTEITNGCNGNVTRGHTIESITSDAFSGGGKLVVNSTCIDIDPGATSAHPDFHQSYAPSPDFVEDVILYNVRGYDCRSQGLFGSRLRNAAFVNVLFERVPDGPLLSQYSGPLENVLYLHINIINQTWLWRDGYDGTDVKVLNSIFGKMDDYPAAVMGGTEIDHNHFSGSDSMGTNLTTGPTEYVDPSTKDYHLASTSPAFAAGRPLQCVPADIDGVARNAAAPSLGAYAAAGVPGDANGDGAVNLSDFVILKNHFGTPSGATVAEGDFNGDGKVDLADFVILKNHFGSGL